MWITFKSGCQESFCYRRNVLYVITLHTRCYILEFHIASVEKSLHSKEVIPTIYDEKVICHTLCCRSKFWQLLTVQRTVLKIGTPLRTKQFYISTRFEEDDRWPNQDSPSSQHIPPTDHDNGRKGVIFRIFSTLSILWKMNLMAPRRYYLYTTLQTRSN